MAGLREQKRKAAEKKREDEPATEQHVKQIIKDLQLSKKEAVFVREFIIDYSVPKAGERAGISRSSSYEYIKRARVIIAIRQLQELHDAYDGITPQTLKGQMAIWANSCIGDYFDNEWNLKPTSELSKRQLSCIQSLQKTYSKDGLPQYKLTLVDKAKANENLARAYGLYQAPKDDPHEFDNMTPEEIEYWLNNHEPE